MLRSELHHDSKLAGVAAGKRLSHVITGARSATGSVAFAAQPAANDTVTINGLVVTFKASGATGNQVNIGADLTATINALVTFLNAHADPRVALATYANVANTSMSVTYDAKGGNDFTLAESGASISVVAMAGGVGIEKMALDVETYELVTLAGAASTFALPDGENAQEVTLFFKTKGTGANAVVSGNFVGGTSATFDTAGDMLKLKFLGGLWRPVVNASVTIA